MRTVSIPATDVLVAHEQAAMEIGELRRKGIHCHLAEHADESGHHVEVVRDREIPLIRLSPDRSVRRRNPLA